MNLNLYNEVPDGLSQRARWFVGAHGVKADAWPIEERRQWWLERGVPAAVIDRMAAYQAQWGGLILPPSPQYDGGPRYLGADSPMCSTSDGWLFDAGMQRTAVPYSFMIGPSGEFGIRVDRWVPLHATVAGWVESLALSDHVSGSAKQILRVAGDDVDDIVLDGYEPVSEVKGLADTWWRGPESVVAIYTGEAEALSFPRGRTALIYSGLREWDLRSV